MIREEWRVRTVLGGSQQDFVFTSTDTVWPERAARDLAAALVGSVDYLYINHRRTTLTDWEIVK